MKVLLRVVVFVVAVLIIIFVFTKDAGEKNGRTQSPEQIKSSLIKADMDFAEAAAAKGTGRAFIDYADDGVILLRQNAYPVKGKKALVELYKGRDTVRTPLTWKPEKAEVSPDGQLGYTFGNWKYTVIDKSGKESASYGNYVTIWKKQVDGTWKYVLDGGSDTPPPAE